MFIVLFRCVVSRSLIFSLTSAPIKLYLKKIQARSYTSSIVFKINLDTYVAPTRNAQKGPFNVREEESLRHSVNRAQCYWIIDNEASSETRKDDDRLNVFRPTTTHASTIVRSINQFKQRPFEPAFAPKLLINKFQSVTSFWHHYLENQL